jgi:DNA-binding response OmpR family regulator
MAAIRSLPQFVATVSRENAQEPDPENTGELVEIGDFRIDIQRHRATLRGVRLELTGEEFDILAFLTANPQRVVTPQTTLATHWNGARIRHTQLLRVLLSLRKKLEDAATGRQYLQTEPSVVYRFDPIFSPAK